MLTVSISASATFPFAFRTSVTPLVSVVGTQQNSANPYRNSIGLYGTRTRINPSSGVKPNMATHPYPSAPRPALSACVISSVFSVAPDMTKMITTHTVWMTLQPLTDTLASALPAAGTESPNKSARQKPQTRKLSSKKARARACIGLGSGFTTSASIAREARCETRTNGELVKKK